jgi:hypothetical protein
MRLRLLLVAASVCLAGCGSGGPYVIESNSPVTPSPTVTRVRAMSWPAPNRDLTPGAVTPGCTYPRPKKQRDVTRRTEDTVDAWYHYHGPFGLAHVEYDHRVPFSLCGSNGPANIWPEPYDSAPTSRYVHNRKDQLEEVIATKVRHHKMTLVQGQAIFLGDWRVAWCRYVHAAGVTC